MENKKFYVYEVIDLITDTTVGLYVDKESAKKAIERSIIFDLESFGFGEESRYHIMERPVYG